MSDALIEAMKTAGARSDDLWKIARTDIPPAEAAAELRRTYPAAFGPTIDARTATPAEYAKAKKDALDVIKRDRNAAYQIREFERLGIKYGVKK